MSKPNEHFIALAKAALKLCEIDLTSRDPMALVSLNIQMGNLSALAKIALDKEAKTVRDSNGRPVCDIEFENDGDGGAYICSATYDDDGSGVSENELDYLTEQLPELCDEYAQESFAMRCEDAYDAARGH